MLFLGYKDYPSDENYVAKARIPPKNSTEGKSESMNRSVVEANMCHKFTV